MKILVLPGDGIGPEITAATVAVLEAADAAYGLGLELETRDIGLASLPTLGTTMPQEALDRVREVDATVLGPVSHYEYPPRAEGGINPSAALRATYQLHANVRPCRSVADLSVLRTPMDLIMVRENTEGFYSDRSMVAGTGEFMPDADTALSVRKITRRASTEAARAAFELAMTRRKRVTAVHKANVLKLSDGLFLESVRAVAADFPQVELRELIVDGASARLIRAPGDFDVIVTTNMFGDILSDEASELCGSLGLGGSINISREVCVAQAQHGSAPDIAGQGIANPVSLIRSAAMMLDWLGRRHDSEAYAAAAAAIEVAVDRVIADPTTRTPDLGGTLTTAQVTAAILAGLTTTTIPPTNEATDD
ncbi:MAG: isocitrate/isopropylmalate dehydrogenase family protein [Tetrasphaera sp.]